MAGAEFFPCTAAVGVVGAVEDDLPGIGAAEAVAEELAGVQVACDNQDACRCRGGGAGGCNQQGVMRQAEPGRLPAESVGDAPCANGEHLQFVAQDVGGGAQQAVRGAFERETEAVVVERDGGLPVMVEYDYFPAAGSVAVGKHRGNEQQACQPRRRLQVAGFVFEQVVAEAENHAVDERHGEGGRVEVFEVDDVGGEGLEAAGQGTAQDFARRHQDLPHGGRQREACGCGV